MNDLNGSKGVELQNCTTGLCCIWLGSNLRGLFCSNLMLWTEYCYKRLLNCFFTYLLRVYVDGAAPFFPHHSWWRTHTEPELGSVCWQGAGFRCSRYTGRLPYLSSGCRSGTASPPRMISQLSGNKFDVIPQLWIITHSVHKILIWHTSVLCEEWNLNYA